MNKTFLVIMLLFSTSVGIRSSEHNSLPVNIVFIGDSITEGTIGASYFDRLKLIDEPWGLDRVNMTNSGENGYRLGFFYGNPHIVADKISNKNPNYVVIYIGINDVEFNLPQNFKLHYEYLIETVYAQDEDNSIQNIFLIQFSYSFDVDENVAQEYLNVIANVSTEYDLPILDLWSPTYQNQSLFVDSVHPNSDGAELIAKEIDNAFGDLIDLGIETHSINGENTDDSAGNSGLVLVGSIILITSIIWYKFRHQILGKLKR